MSGASISYPHQCYHQQRQPVGFGASGGGGGGGAERQFGFDPYSSVSTHQSRTESRSVNIENSENIMAMATCYSSYEISSPQPHLHHHNHHPHQQQQQQQQQQRVQVSVQTVLPQKDYSRPLHVDCSVEYELPNAAKPPQGVRNEPLLMIHPCYFRKIESQRRSPFVNNLPATASAAATATSSVVVPNTTSATPKRRPRGQQLPPLAPQQAAQYPAPQHYHHPTASGVVERHQPQQQQQQSWEQMPPLVPISQAYCTASSKRTDLSRDQHHQQQQQHHHHLQQQQQREQQQQQQQQQMVSACVTYTSSGSDSGIWTDSERSPDRPEDKHILSGKYRQFLRAHRLHPYVTSAIPLASTFPHQIHHQSAVCYNAAAV